MGALKRLYQLHFQDERRERLITLTVGLFGDLGHEHPLTMRYRRRLAASLY